MDIVNLAHASYYLLGGYVGPHRDVVVGELLSRYCLRDDRRILLAVFMERFFLRVSKETPRTVSDYCGFHVFFPGPRLGGLGGDPHGWWLRLPHKEYQDRKANLPRVQVFIIALATAVAVGLWWLRKGRGSEPC